MTKTRKTFIKNAAAVGSTAAVGGLSAASAPTPDGGKCPIRCDPPAFHCVVTGQTKSGKSVIVSHEPVHPVTVAMMSGYEFYRLWGSDATPALPSDGTPTAQPRYFPPKNGFRFGMFTLPPATSANNEQALTPAVLDEMRQKLPGALEVLETDHPGMHTTDSVDFDVVVFGEVVLELDDGAEFLLKAGDCVIQNGTRHAWHNRSTEKCVIAFSLVGAERKGTT